MFQDPSKKSVDVIHLSYTPFSVEWIQRLSDFNSSSRDISSRVFYFYELGCFQSIKLFVSFIFFWAKSKKILLVAHGHTPSVLALALSFLPKVSFIVVHHNQPRFFWLRDSFKFKVHRMLAFLYLKKSDGIQSLSDEVTFFLSSQNLEFGKIVEIGHGAQDRYFNPANLSFHRSQPQSILMVGRLSWEKNFEYAFKLLSSLAIQGEKFVLRIAGTGPQNQVLKEITDCLEDKLQVEFLGNVSNLQDTYCSSDLFLHTSLTESYGQVLIEAALHGLPIVSTKVGVVSELLRRDINLRVISGNDIVFDLPIIQGMLQNLDFINRKQDSSFAKQVLAPHHSYSACLRESNTFIKSVVDRLA